MNTKLLRRVQKAILDHPDQFEMNWYFTRKLHLAPIAIQAGGCGTAACIAGWACHLTGTESTLHSTYVMMSLGWSDAYTKAKEHLQIGDGQAERLFGCHLWPKGFSERYDTAKRPLTRARAAADRIDHFIATKGAE